MCLKAMSLQQENPTMVARATVEIGNLHGHEGLEAGIRLAVVRHEHEDHPPDMGG